MHLSTRRSGTAATFAVACRPDPCGRSPRRHDGKDAQGATAALKDLQRRGDNKRAGRRQAIEIAQALQPVFAGAVHVVMAGIGRRKVCGLPGIGANRFRAEAEHVPLLHQEAHAIGIGTRRVLAGFIKILISDQVGALRPVGAHQYPCLRRYAAVPLFPGFDKRNGEQEIGIVPCLRAAIDHASRGDEMIHRQSVGRIIRQGAARDPVYRCVEVRAGMLAEAHIVPVPSRPTIVVTRNFLHAERTALAHVRR